MSKAKQSKGGHACRFESVICPPPPPHTHTHTHVPDPNPPISHTTPSPEIFLVQQRELDRAIACIRKKVDATLSFLLEQRSASVPASTDSEGTPPPPDSPMKAEATATTTSPSSSSAAAAGATGDDPERHLREKLRIRQWQPPQAAAAKGPVAAALHFGGHSHQQAYDHEAEAGSPHLHQQQQRGRRQQQPPAAQPHSHHVHSSHHPWTPLNGDDPPPPPPLSSSPFSLQGAPKQPPPPPLVLRVMPKRLALARIHKDFLPECAGVLTRLLLFDQAPAAQFSTSTSSSSSTTAAAASLGATRGVSGGRRPCPPHYYQRERSGSLGEPQDFSPAASAHASSVPRLIPRSVGGLGGVEGGGGGGGYATPSSTLSGGGGGGGVGGGSGASPSPSIGASPELLVRA